MANSIVNAGDDGAQALVIARESLRQLKNQTVMGNRVHRDYTTEYAKKIGDTFRIRRPVQFVANDGPTMVVQDVTEKTFTMSVNLDKHVAWLFNQRDLTLSIEQYSERYIKPAMIQLANEIDLALTGLYKDVWNWVGVADANLKVDSFSDFAVAPQRLDEMAVPRDMRSAVLAPADNWGIVGSMTGLDFPGIGEGAFREASLGKIGGIPTFMDQNILAHTVGSHDSAALNSGTLSTTYATAGENNEMTLTAANFDASTVVLKQGDVINLAGVFAINPVSKQAQSYLQDFVVKSDVTSSGAGAASITVSPAIITSGPYQTVSAAPASNATITVKGTADTAYRQNLVFHKNAFALAMVQLKKPEGVAFSAVETFDGYSCSVTKAYDQTNREETIRIDILAAVKAIDPRLATRLGPYATS